jgi:hypothetical protein
MVRRLSPLALMFVAAFWLSGCQAETAPPVKLDASRMRFSGDLALQTEAEFVQTFPNRHSGQPNNHLAAEWLQQQFVDAGLKCSIDRWTVINYSRPVDLNNVVCRLPGESGREVVMTAHLDQAPTTVQGADNDGSGIAILLQLAQIFASEPKPAHTLVFVATDAEEYGMLGTSRFVSTHPDPRNIVADMSLDNLGRTYYDGMKLELIGQFQGYGPIWLPLTAREAARAAGTKWDVYLRSPFDQVVDQAAPVSMMDQGPMVAAGVPALGFAGREPPEAADLHFHLWHDPDDNLSYQSAEALGQSGLIAEALTRQLLGMKAFPTESGPYLYFDASGQVLRGLPLWLIFAAFVGIFFVASYFSTASSWKARLHGWALSAPHFLGLWIPLVVSIIFLYWLVAVGLLDRFDRYFATTKDPMWTHPRWPAVLLFVACITLLIVLGRRLARVRYTAGEAPTSGEVRSLATLVLGACGLYILAVNPFGLLFMLPVLLWLLIQPRGGVGKALNMLLFLLGGLLAYAMVYIFGFQVLHINWAFLWYMLNMFSVGTIAFPMALTIMAIIAAGLTLVVAVPKPKGAAA